MTAIAKRNTAQQARQIIKARLNAYDWAESLFRDNVLKAPVMHTLKAIIACNKLDRPTLEQINKARTKSSSLKFAQSDPVSIRTLERHIKKLETLKLITVNRYLDAWYSRNDYVINMPESKLVDSPHDNVSGSISSFSSQGRRERKTNFNKQKEDEQNDTGTGQTLEQWLWEVRHTKLYSDAVAALEAMNIFKPVAYISLRERLPDNVYFEIERLFNIQLSDKMKELEQRL